MSRKKGKQKLIYIKCVIPSQPKTITSEKEKVIKPLLQRKFNSKTKNK